MGRFRVAALCAAVLLSCSLGFGGTAASAPALWRVQGERSEVYLFGSLHALPPNLAWRTPAYDAAYRKAGVVWFEAAIDGADPRTVNDLLIRYGIDPQRPLSRKLEPAALAELGRHVDLRRIDHLRPWAAALMLSMQPVLGQGASVEAGVDLAMARAARESAKQVRTFETLEDQARLFADLPEGAELRYLTDVIRERSPKPRRLFRPSPATLAEAWMDGDLTRLGAALVGGMKAENPSLYEALLRRRNLAWADTLARELATASGVELVNVGALHLVGDDGLPALLAARGFKVERVQ